MVSTDPAIQHHRKTPSNGSDPTSRRRSSDIAVTSQRRGSDLQIRINNTPISQLQDSRGDSPINEDKSPMSGSDYFLCPVAAGIEQGSWTGEESVTGSSIVDDEEEDDESLLPSSSIAASSTPDNSSASLQRPTALNIKNGKRRSIHPIEGLDTLDTPNMDGTLPECWLALNDLDGNVGQNHHKNKLKKKHKKKTKAKRLKKKVYKTFNPMQYFII